MVELEVAHPAKKRSGFISVIVLLCVCEGHFARTRYRMKSFKKKSWQSSPALYDQKLYKTRLVLLFSQFGCKKSTPSQSSSFEVLDLRDVVAH